MKAAQHSSQQSRWLYRSGAALLMLGLISGLTTALVANPRMGLSAHVEGVLNGIMLVGFGSAWPNVALPRHLKSAAMRLLIFGSAINWLATQLSAVWGTGKLTPIMAPRPSGAMWQEMIVSVMLALVAVAILVGTLLVLIGFCRTDDEETSLH